jgi:hypothetical protein
LSPISFLGYFLRLLDPSAKANSDSQNGRSRQPHLSAETSNVLLEVCRLSCGMLESVAYAENGCRAVVFDYDFMSYCDVFAHLDPSLLLRVLWVFFFDDSSDSLDDITKFGECQGSNDGERLMSVPSDVNYLTPAHLPQAPKLG